jgi:hypothetical protein
MYPDAGITGSVQSLARNGRLAYASITGGAALLLALAAYHQRQDSSAAPPGTVYHSGYLPDGNG